MKANIKAKIQAHLNNLGLNYAHVWQSDGYALGWPASTYCFCHGDHVQAELLLLDEPTAALDDRVLTYL